jgi:hypothetical protein
MYNSFCFKLLGISKFIILFMALSNCFPNIARAICKAEFALLEATNHKGRCTVNDNGEISVHQSISEEECKALCNSSATGSVQNSLNLMEDSIETLHQVDAGLYCDSNTSTSQKGMSSSAIAKDIRELRKRTLLDHPSAADQHYIKNWYSKLRLTHGQEGRPFTLLGVPHEPETSSTSLDPDGLPTGSPPSMIEGRYGKAALIQRVLNRATSLTGQGIEYQKGGIANLLDIMVEGLAHGYSAPMITGDGSYSALAHGPYWVIFDLAKINTAKDNILIQIGSNAIFTAPYHLAYVVPDEKYKEVIDALKVAVQKGLITAEDFHNLNLRIIPYNRTFPEKSC